MDVGHRGAAKAYPGVVRLTQGLSWAKTSVTHAPAILSFLICKGSLGGGCCSNSTPGML